MGLLPGTPVFCKGRWSKHALEIAGKAFVRPLQPFSPVANWSVAHLSCAC